MSTGKEVFHESMKRIPTFGWGFFVLFGYSTELRALQKSLNALSNEFF